MRKCWRAISWRRFPVDRLVSRSQIRAPTGGEEPNESVPILLPECPSAEDLFLARFLSAELSDRYALALRTKRVGLLPERGPFILMGSAGNPLVQQHARQGHPAVSEREGYLLDVDRDRAARTFRAQSSVTGPSSRSGASSCTCRGATISHISDALSGM